VNKDDAAAVAAQEGRPRQTERPKWKALFAGSLAHFIHDGFIDMLYVFFPLWQAKWALSFAEVGMLKTLVSGFLAAFQLPAGIIASRIGPVRLLFAGTIISSLAAMLWGFAAGPAMLALLLGLSGLGASVQHPVSSAMISDAYADVKIRRTALSAYNFCGDVGKLVLPGTAAFLIANVGWEAASRLLALFGFLVAAVLFFSMLGGDAAGSASPAPEAARPAAGGLLLGWSGYQAFWSLTLIGVLDNATRTGFLTFLPFLLRDKGAGVAAIGLALTLIYAGGAAGKLVCGILATRIGVLRSVIATEIVTALCIGGMIGLSLEQSFFLAPLLGVALNGTSSVLYGSVPELVLGDRRKQAFAIFYTLSLGAGAISPSLYGLLSDFAGVKGTVSAIAAIVLAVVPLTLPLRGKLGN